MKKANLFNDSIGLTIIQKMDFAGLEAVHDALCFAFYPNSIDEDEDLDVRFMSLWNLFLSSVGWNEDEFWEEYHEKYHQCPNCQQEPTSSDEKSLDNSKDNKNIN